MRARSAPEARSPPRELKAIEDREIERVIKSRKRSGFKSITDGEFRRSWWHLDFLWGLDGIEKHVMDEGIAFRRGHDPHRRREGHRQARLVQAAPMIEHFKFVQRTPADAEDHHSLAVGDLRPAGRDADRQVGLSEMDDFFDDLGQAYRKAVRAFADAGCRYLQLDEVFIALLCDPKYRDQCKRGDDPRSSGRYIEAVQRRDVGHPADMTISMHLCRGNYNSTFMGAGSYDAERRSDVQPDQRARLFHGV